MKTGNIKFRDKLQIIILLMLSISVGICGTWLIGFSFISSKNQKIEAIENGHKLAMYTLVSSAGEDNWQANELSSALRVLERQIGQRFRLSDKDGNIIYQKVYNDKSFKGGLLEKVTEDKLVWRIQKNSFGKHEIQMASAIGNGEQIFYLESIYPIEKIYRARDDMISRFIGIMFFIIIIGIVMTRQISFWITGSLTKLAKTARAISEGELSKRVDIKSNDEIGQLAYDFNKMAERVEENIIKLEQTMQRQEEFMASFAHELRTPMTSIIGYADIIRSQELSPDIRSKAANYIFTEGKRLESLSNKLLDIIVLEKRDIIKQECKIDSLINQICDFMQIKLEKSNVKTKIFCENEIWLVEPDLIKTLIINLMDNARKAMPNGGLIEISAKEKSEFYEIIVKDDGYGISKSEIPRLTEAFYRVDKARARASGGAGLGLALCSKIAELHGGKISFISEKDCGTTVYVLLKKENIL